MKRWIAVLMIVLLLTGCSSKPAEPQTEQPQAQAQELTAEVVVAAIQCEILRSSFGQTQEQYLSYLEETTTYEVESIQVTDNTATATVNVTAKDMYTVAVALEKEEVTSADEFDARIVEKLKGAGTIEKTVEVAFEKTDAIWNIVMSEELVDALYGGLLTYQQEYAQKEAAQ